MKEACIRAHVDGPDLSGLPTQEFDWTKTVHGEQSEPVPSDAPEPLGNPAVTTTFVDANLMHDILTGKSVTGILHFVNETPFDWYAKKQATVETATFGSEVVAARTAVEQIIGNRDTLRYLGVPVSHVSYMFGDNQSVVDSSSFPEGKLHKRHNMLSFHKVRQVMAAGFLKFHHLVGTSNVADVLSKHWGYSNVWHLMRPILFYQDEEDVVFSEDELKKWASELHTDGTD